MATKRKSSPKSKQKHISKTQTHIMLRRSMFVYMLIVFFAFILVSLSAYSIVNVYTAYHNQQRYNRIVSIFNDLGVGRTGYVSTQQNIFGDKRVYEYDQGRTQASSYEGGHNDTPANTIKELTVKIEAAGFAPIGNAYKGSIAPQYYFKNDRDEYVRLQVTTAALHDNFIYGIHYANPLSESEWQKAPSYYTVKVNLDDNNE